jgi:hypothetical protein
MLSDGIKTKTYSLRNKTEELNYILKLKNGTMGEKNYFKSNLFQFSEVYMFHRHDHRGRIILK